MLADIDIACGMLNCYKPNLGSCQLTCDLLCIWIHIWMRGCMVMSSKPKAIDEIFFLPQRVQIVLAFMTVLVVAFCLGLPVAFLGLVLEMELVQHFLRRLDGKLCWDHSCQ